MGLDLDEFVFGKAVKFLKWRREGNKELLEKVATLDEIKSKLTLIARAISGQAIEIFPAEKEGGYKDLNFFLPIRFSEFPKREDNLKFYLFRVVYLCCQKELDLNWTEGNFHEEQSEQKAKETSSQVLTLMFEQYPSLEEWYNYAQSFLTSVGKKQKDLRFWLYGKWMLNSGGDAKAKNLENFGLETKTQLQDIETTIQARAVEEIESLTIDKKQQEDYVLLHNFEKVETAEEFNGNWRDFDGKDELEDHQDAVDELNMRFTVRVDDMVHSVYQADFVENTTVAESSEVDEQGFHLKYDEWNDKKKAYLKDYCKVYPRTQIASKPNYYHNALKKYSVILRGLRKMLTSVNNKMQVQRRQAEGSEFDLDALTDLYTDIHSGVSPDERVYLSQRKKEKDIAILLLLDNSLSSDAYTAGNHIIDIEKEVSILFGEILNEFDMQFSIDGFYSKTRNYTVYTTYKDFETPWDTAKNRIGMAEPCGYTRIGPALRHAGARLNKTDAKNKWLILLSDGKPNDYDKYEGKHGINDIKQAIRELNEQGINSYALAIEAQAKYYLPQMFGQNHYQILSSPEDLLKSLVKLYERIKHQ